MNLVRSTIKPMVGWFAHGAGDAVRVGGNLTVLVCALSGVGAGCGASEPSGDAGSDSGVVDSGSVDAGFDAPPDAGDNNVDRDAGTSRSYTVCDPYSGVKCDETEKCQVVLDPEPGSGTDLYFGCVPKSSGEVQARLPCTATVSLTVPVGTDAVTHSCAPGGVCVVKDGFASCRPLCGQAGLSCERETELCLLVTRSPAVAACIRASDCDPVGQGGCAAGQACYLRNNGQGDWIGDCASPIPRPGQTEPLVEGSPCQFFDHCEAGTGCLLDLSPTGEFVGEGRCRRFCDADAASQSCGNEQVCRPLPLPAGGIFYTPLEPGACYTPAV